MLDQRSPGRIPLQMQFNANICHTSGIFLYTLLCVRVCASLCVTLTTGQKIKEMRFTFDLTAKTSVSWTQARCRKTDDGGAYIWIPKDRENSDETELRKKKARRGRPRYHPSLWQRAWRRNQVREQNASLVEPVDVANSSQSTRDEGSMSRKQA
jgi:hypothetical protein